MKPRKFNKRKPFFSELPPEEFLPDYRKKVSSFSIEDEDTLEHLEQNFKKEDGVDYFFEFDNFSANLVGYITVKGQKDPLYKERLKRYKNQRLKFEVKLSQWEKEKAAWEADESLREKELYEELKKKFDGGN